MITMKDVIREGHPTLYIKAKEVTLPLSDEDKHTLISLHEYVINSIDENNKDNDDYRPSVGIAAPQINISKRLYAVHVHDLDGTLYSYMLINPEIINKSDSLIYLPGGEGCLSVDRDTEGLTPRYETVTLQALRYLKETDDVVPISLHLEGYIGIVFQHELDHLNGILYTQKLFPTLLHAKPAFELPESEDGV